jgi:hypothetical protein
MASGFDIEQILYKSSKMHEGMDFTAKKKEPNFHR